MSIKGCKTCASVEGDSFELEEFDVHIRAFPEMQLIHLHYGLPTIHEDKNIEEAQWVFDTYQTIFEKYPNTPFCSIVDFNTSADLGGQEFVATDSLKIYKKLVSLPQNKLLLGHGVNGHYILIIKLLLLSLRKDAKKVKVLHSLEEAEELYQSWIHEQREGNE